MIATDDPRHGLPAGYYAGCRQDCCRSAALRYVKRLRLDTLNGISRKVPARGTIRRVEALMCLGWSQAHIAERAEMDQPNLSKLMRRNPATVYRSTAERIARVYDDLSMTVPPLTHSTSRVRNLARARNYAPPLAWDCIDTDPAPVGITPGDEAGVDVAVVERILAGDNRVRANTAERREVTRRWTASGRSLAELARVTGWKVERYVARGVAA